MLGIAFDLLQNERQDLAHSRLQTNLAYEHYSEMPSRFLRTRLSTVVKYMLRTSQCGGIQGEGADMASHMVRAAMELARAPKRSFLVVFTDLRAAFYRVLREFVFGGLVRHEEWDALIDSSDTLLILQPIMDKRTNEPGVSGKSVKDPQLVSVLQDVHQDAWFAVRG
eukprot:9483465-Pyramimonas_sp.AAC.1